MAHVPAHDISARRRGTAQHDEQCDEFLIPKAQRYRAGQEHRRKAHGLDERRRQRGAELFDGLCPLKRRADGQERQRRGQRRNAADGFGRDLRQRERQQRIDRAEHNAQQDRVCGHAAQELLRVRHAALLGRFQHQDQHRKDVEKRHTAQNHERGHAGAAVNVLDERHAQHGGAAAVARLHELAYQRLVLQKTFSPRPDGQDADEGGGKAEQHKPGPEVVQDVHAAHVQKQHERQSHLKSQPVRRLAKRGRQKAELPQRVPHHHDKEHRQGRVQAEN